MDGTTSLFARLPRLACSDTRCQRGDDPVQAPQQVIVGHDVHHIRIFPFDHFEVEALAVGQRRLAIRPTIAAEQQQGLRIGDLYLKLRRQTSTMALIEVTLSLDTPLGKMEEVFLGLHDCA
jgi:hypothetical protein